MTSQLIGPEHESHARALVALLRDQANRAHVNLANVRAFSYPESTKTRDRADRTTLVWKDAEKSLHELTARIEYMAGYLE